METSITTTVGDTVLFSTLDRHNFLLTAATRMVDPPLESYGTALGDVDALQQAVVIAKKLARPRAAREIQEKRDQPGAGLHWSGG